MTIGTTRRIDQLGRVVIPAPLRRSLAIHEGDLLEIGLVEGQLVVRKVEPECAICGRDGNLIDLRDKHLCKECVSAIRLEPECAICKRLDNLVELRDGHVCKDCVHELGVV
jgi:AbrB family transcriptional regulator, transcriptional pleiotropic regulator of transition state genes